MTGYGAMQLLVLRAKSFAKRQPTDTVMDIEQVTEFAKGEEAQMQSRSPMMQQVRERLVAETKDPHDAVLRDRVVGELVSIPGGSGSQRLCRLLNLKAARLCRTGNRQHHGFNTPPTGLSATAL
jgi:hypothetical protein